MSAPIHNRILAYSGSLALHAGNGLAMAYCLYFGEAMQNPNAELKQFRNMSYRFITIWNVIFHIAYAILSLSCELYDVMELRKYQQQRQTAQKIRVTFFCSLLWPLTVSISTVFWPLYIYDRELIFPTFIDKVLSQVSNQVMHTSILAFVLWEAAYNPKTEVKYWLHFKLYTGMFTLYLITLLFTYHQFGAYPYPILKYLTNTQLAAFLFALYIVLNISYVLQWYLTPILTKYVKTRRNKKDW